MGSKFPSTMYYLALVDMLEQSKASSEPRWEALGSDTVAIGSKRPCTQQTGAWYFPRQTGPGTLAVSGWSLVLYHGLKTVWSQAALAWH